MQIAFCGLDCARCPSYLATLSNDDAARAKAAEFYRKEYGFTLDTKEINCNGCQAESGIRLVYCKTCAVRKCGMEKGVTTCVECRDRPCSKLEAFHAFSPVAKRAFERLLI